MMMYLKALPNVWPSSRNSKEAAVGVDPGNYKRETMINHSHVTTYSMAGGKNSYQEQLVFLVNFLQLHFGLVLHDGVVSVFCRHFVHLTEMRSGSVDRAVSGLLSSFRRK